MNNNIINNLDNSRKATLKFLTNPVYQKNTVPLIEEKTIKYKNSDIKFYKKRILNLTKQMFRNNFPSPYLKNIFQSYIETLIEYLIIQDENDIIQEDYKEYDIINNKYENETNEVLLNKNQTYNNLMMKEKKKETINTLDNFILKDNSITNEVKFIPQKKTFDLKKPLLKTKGIDKKNLNK